MTDELIELRYLEGRARKLIKCIPDVPSMTINTTADFWLALALMNTNLRILDAIREGQHE